MSFAYRFFPVCFVLFSLSSKLVLAQGFEPVSGKNGLVVSAHPLASEAGLSVLKAGGNAFDAAVAVGFALQSVYPTAGNIGGGGFAVIRLQDGSSYTLDFRETAPFSSSRDMFIKNGKADNQLSTVGALSAGVPGTVDGLYQLHKKWGKLSWKSCVNPSVHLAKFHILSQKAASVLNLFRSDLSRFPETASIYLKKDGSEWETGDTLFQPDLAKTLERIAVNGASEFYSGETSRLLVNSVKKYNGVISASDLNAYQSKWRNPLKGTYHGSELISMGLPSSGGIILLQTLNMLENQQIDSTDFRSTRFVHDFSRALQLAYSDRAQYMGDPDFVSVPFDTLISKPYALRRFRQTNPEKKIPSSEIQAGNIAGFEHEETTHYSIIDKEGNAVSITYTLNGAFGSFLVVDGAGFLLNNEMDDFSIQPGVPNSYGLFGGRANEIQPGKRMLSSMTPLIVVRDNKPWLIIGSPGGSTIPTTVLQTFLNVFHFKMSVQEAVNAGRIHYQWVPDILFYEKHTLSSELVKNLEKLGYKCVQRSGYQGRCEAIEIKNGWYLGGADPRGNDSVSAW
ncbi:MAG: gamma-glutamyltransferase [Bacteroidetes bacterium]|nr:gamma-glutamyltransferase [Bacteroidota bacterium]